MKSARLARASLGSVLLLAGLGSDEAAAWPAPAPQMAQAATGEPAPEEPAADAAAADADAAAAAVATEDDGFDLGSLDLDPHTPMFDDSLQLYGFADFTWMSLRARTTVIPKTISFGIGKLNLYLRKNLSPKWRSLAEVRFLISPNGSFAADGSPIDDAVSDPANFERPIRWGGIYLERAYLEYDVAPWLTVRAGRFLTPYGIWNIDHGSPTIIGANRPYMVGEQFLPEQQTGLQFFGSRAVGDASTLEYHVTLSNGRNPFDATRDPDLSPAVGGRVSLETPMVVPFEGTLRIGVSGYVGRATDAANAAGPQVEYKELAFGLDAAWDRGGIHLQTELLTTQRNYEEGKRPMTLFGGFAPDSFSWGAYGLAGYRFSSWGNVMPYVVFEHYKAIDPTLFGRVMDVAGGLNLRPLPSVTLKAEFLYADFGSGGLYGDQSLDVLRFQSAWVF